ncbi:MAG: family 20 glycosylhydrolase, partial [Clostridia bacterium]|nr:family 20 glycosylhydrolase [Clostridia bacterium]
AGKYLKTSELIDICNVAKEYHIDIIPSFDSPAHLDYLTWKFEQNYKSNSSYSFTYNDTTYKASSNSGCINYTNTTGASAPTYYYAAANIKDGSMGRAFLFAIYEDLADFFKEYAGSTDFSIGADEVPNPSSRIWSYSDFVDYINDLNALLKGKGYTMRMFNDYLGSTSYNYTSGISSTSNQHSFNTDIEIMYWDSPYDQNSGSSSGTATVKASVLEKEGFTLYNCIQSNCYYVLRVANSSSVSSTYKYMDARNPDNLNWSFNYSTEEKIYSTWTPNDMGEKGKNSTTDTVSSIGGAYFLIWNDYASVSTESEIWNGAEDNTGTSSNTYYLLDRMWSNTMKMWNWDVDDSVTYSNFKAVRETYGYFPGYTSCSAAASLPAATSVTEADEYRADHSALNTALANKISNDDGKYTSDSYAKYEAAYAAAEKVNAENGATAEEITAAIEALNTAKSNLTEAKTDSGDTDDNNTGTNPGTTASTTLEYEIARLEYWKANVINEQGSYTADSWKEYVEAKEALESYDVTGKTRDEVHDVVSAYEAALTALTVNADATQIISITALSKTVRSGKQVGLKVVTTGDVSALTVADKTLNVCSGKVQTLSDGSVVKVWLIYFNAGTETGDITYTVNAGNDVTESVTVTIK